MDTDKELDSFNVKYYFSPLFLIGCTCIITGFWVFAWVPVVATGLGALTIDWFVRRSSVRLKFQWMWLLLGAAAILFFLYFLLGIHSQASADFHEF